DKVLKKQIKSLAENREELNKVSTLIAELETIAAHTKMGIAKQAEKQKEITEKWNEIAAEMKIQLGTEAQRTLESEQLKIKTSLDELRKKTAGLKEMGTKLEKLKNELYAAEKQLGQLKLTLQKISDGEKQLVFDRERLQKDLTESGKELETLENTLKNELKGFGEVLPEDGNLNQLVRKLEDRSKRYLASRRELDTYKTKLGPLREQGSKLETQIKSQVEREEEEKKNKESMQRGLAVLISRRKNLLGDKNPEKERTELKKQRRIFDVKLLELNAHLQKNRSDLAAKQQTLSDRKKEQGILLNTIRSAFETLQTDIGKVGFAGEEEFVKALLTSEEQEMLETIKKRLRLRETQTTTRLDDARKKLEVETAKKLTEEDFETIQSVELEKKEQLEKLQLELGAIQEMMRQHDRQKNEKKEQLEKIVGQQQEFDRWDSLNRLIGAADGKKFRRFAQGLTLDYLINLANKNLTKLNDRYYLKRNQLEELGLEVIDMYQADVSRPVSTLSGGETFLVSLALALGLSGLVSKNTSIDSLFLDEGFGTLDTETLETALAALDNLNAEGKTIGIISHVEALKDRISTQLQVKKLSGGVSALEVVQ
ncbi:hypothetical protein KKA14_15650, partial [bacterium]|nr:hypothetical protein [bacterium]